MFDSGSLKAILRQRLDVGQINALKKVYRRSQQGWLRAFHSGNLRRIGTTFNAGKLDWYYPAYERHFGDLRSRRVNLLELGIGGYETPAAGGGSLRMWESYMPRARVHGVDIYDKSPHDAGRVQTYKGSQADETFLHGLIGSIGRPDIVIDDGSHINEHVLASFRILFPLLADDGIYVVEDTQSSYWESFGGSPDELSRHDTTMGLVKDLLDGLNHKEFSSPKRPPSVRDSTIVGVHCYHNIVFIQKGRNDDPSNIV